MKKRSSLLRAILISILAIVVLAIVVVACLSFLWPGLLPQLTGNGTAPASAGTGTTDQVGAQQAIIDQLRFLLGGLALGLTAIVTIQTVFQSRHDRIQDQGAEQISNVVGVIEKTLQTRLDAEIEARAEAKKAKEEMADMSLRIERITRRLEQQDTIITSERDAIEGRAEALARTARHDFRRKVRELTALARQFDTFVNQSMPLEEPPKKFSARVLYVRGIAAHYDNEPGLAIKYLEQVIAMPQGNEPERSIKSRVANAYYYLGVTYANFGHSTQALDNLSEAISRATNQGDYLTRVVNAETLASSGHEADADPEQRLTTSAQQAAKVAADIARRYPNGKIEPPYLHLRSRALLVQANAAILRGDSSYPATVDNLLRPLLEQDPDYYFGTATLAQTLAMGTSAEAGPLFQQAYEAIRGSGHLQSLTEARSRILLHMTAALCLRQASNDMRHLDQLDAARRLIPELPRLDSEVCTVFSVLTKRNELIPIIEDHINDIHNGTILLPGRGRSGIGN
jgi:tetratricopeptide (TPR) repeat protein